MRVPFLLVAVALTSQAATYYVDSAHGKDSNPGTAPGAPWQTLAKVSAEEFRPGDRILFRSGSAWRGQLAPKSSGAEGGPIVFDRYGEGPKPRIDGDGSVDDAVRLYNVQFVKCATWRSPTTAQSAGAPRRPHLPRQFRNGQAHRDRRAVHSRRQRHEPSARTTAASSSAPTGTGRPAASTG